MLRACRFVSFGFVLSHFSFVSYCVRFAFVSFHVRFVSFRSVFVSLRVRLVVSCSYRFVARSFRVHVISSRPIRFRASFGSFCFVSFSFCVRFILVSFCLDPGPVKFSLVGFVELEILV